MLPVVLVVIVVVAVIAVFTATVIGAVVFVVEAIIIVDSTPEPSDEGGYSSSEPNILIVIIHADNTIYNTFKFELIYENFTSTW